MIQRDQFECRVGSVVEQGGGESVDVGAPSGGGGDGDLSFDDADLQLPDLGQERAVDEAPQDRWLAGGGRAGEVVARRLGFPAAGNGVSPGTTTVPHSGVRRRSVQESRGGCSAGKARGRPCLGDGRPRPVRVRIEVDAGTRVAAAWGRILPVGKFSGHTNGVAWETLDCEQPNFIARLVRVISTRAWSSWCTVMWSSTFREVTDRLNSHTRSPGHGGSSMRCWRTLRRPLLVLV